MTELWDVDHPYYAMEGNFYKRGEHFLAESWAEFWENMKDSDHDLDLLYRWDWQTSGHGGDELLLFFMGQRKARAWSYAVEVTRDDAPAIREWLTERAKTIAAIWAPIDLTPSKPAEVSGR